MHGFLDPGVVGRGGGNHVVELHHDVRADGVLEGDGMLGSEEHGRLVVWAEEADAFFGHFGELEEGDHLEAGLRRERTWSWRELRLVPTLHYLLSVSTTSRNRFEASSSTCQDVVRP